MAGTINYLYNPGQSVYVINKACIDQSGQLVNSVIAVQPGTVVRVRAEVLVTMSKLFYDVQIAGQSGTTELIEADVFADLATAVAEYELRIA